MKPEYDQWAENLLQEIYYAPTDAHREAVIKEHLLKAVQRGYVDGLENGWAKEQDKEYKAYSTRRHGTMCACSICNGDLK